MNLRCLALATTITIGISGLAAGASCASTVLLDSAQSGETFSLHSQAAPVLGVGGSYFGQGPDQLMISSPISRSVRLPSASPTPEPAEWAMLLIGVAAIGWGVRARRRAQAHGSADTHFKAIPPLPVG